MRRNGLCAGDAALHHISDKTAHGIDHIAVAHAFRRRFETFDRDEIEPRRQRRTFGGIRFDTFRARLTAERIEPNGAREFRSVRHCSGH